LEIKVLRIDHAVYVQFVSTIFDRNLVDDYLLRLI